MGPTTAIPASQPLAVTVAALIERDGLFLMVQERDELRDLWVLNQPAGHVDPGEDLLTAVVREAWEEAGVAFTPQAIVGIYQLHARNGRDYLRIAFAGAIDAGTVAAPQDPDIVACHWLSPEQIRAQQPRSSVVMACIADYQAGQRLPLAAICGVFRDR